MDQDFGLLVDFLRGELDEGSAAKVRQRLESDGALFEQFERLHRTYAVLRSMPGVRPVDNTSLPAERPASEFPLAEPRAAFVRDLRREYAVRGWAALVPMIEASPALLENLRVEWFVRALVAKLPPVNLREGFLAALRSEFAVRARTGVLPRIEPRPEWVADLREEFAVRSLGSSAPAVSVREGFERRLKVALLEASQSAAPAAAAEAALPQVSASDPFRRRLFKNVLVNSRRRVREVPQRVDIHEYELGREFKRGLKGSRRSVAFTLVVHAVAIAIMLFVFVENAVIGGTSPRVAIGESEHFIPPVEPSVEDEEFTPGGEPEVFPGVTGENWAPGSDSESVELDATSIPEHREVEMQDEPAEVERPPVVDERAARDAMQEGVAGFFRLRSDPRARKVDYLGSEELYEALDRSLAWLGENQRPDGYWGHVDVDPNFRSRGGLLLIKRLEMTSAALLAFLGDGHNSEDSPLGYDEGVRDGIRWLISHQNESGRIGPADFENVLVHAMATLVLAEEFGMTRAHWIREPLRKASRWLSGVRAKDSEGFPFDVGEEASLTTSVWAYMALATARHVRVPPVDLPPQRIEEFLSWFNERTRGTRPIVDTPPVIAHTELLPKAASSALSLFAVEAGWHDHGPALLRQINDEMPNLRAGMVPHEQRKKNDLSDVRYLFFGSLAQALNLQRNGEKSSEWHARFTDTVLNSQDDDGSYESSSDYNDLYGRVLSTALVSLSIENAYRVSILNE